MHESIEKVKAHVKKNRKIYISGTIGVALGLAGGVVIFHSPALVNAKQVQLLTWKSKQKLEVHVEALGDPGNIIQDIDTGTIYASQGQAARELGLDPAAISKHMNGLTPNVRGRRFAKLGKAPVSE
jgi:hypothetical protein